MASPSKAIVAASTTVDVAQGVPPYTIVLGAGSSLTLPHSVVSTEVVGASIHFGTLHEVARILPAIQVNSFTPVIHATVGGKRKDEESTPQTRGKALTIVVPVGGKPLATASPAGNKTIVASASSLPFKEKRPNVIV